MHSASTIRSVVAGRSERFKHRVYEATGLGEVFNDSNVHLSVKSSPEKTAAGLSLIAEKQGAIFKLNDTGSWRKRRALLVPHTFLYYFDTAATDLRPHGVIDLELYSDIQVIDETVVRLEPSDETRRTFYLRLSDGEEAQAWAQALRETRYDYVREERDALRNAKTGLAYQLVDQAETLRESLALLEASRRRESAAVSELARRDAEEAGRVAQVRALLAASASASASAPTATSVPCGAGGDACSNHDHGVGSSVAKTALSELAALEEAIAERALEIASLKAANEAFRKKEVLARDQCCREVWNALRLRDEERDRAAKEAALRSDLELQLQHNRAELEESKASRDEARANLGVVAAACREAEAKSKELQEHRRVLAREVKASRAEQKRLSAALGCAAKAAVTAAATVAAATNTACAATASTVDASPAVLAATCAAVSGGTTQEVEIQPTQGREGAEGGCDKGMNDRSIASGKYDNSTVLLSCGKKQGAENGESGAIVTAKNVSGATLGTPAYEGGAEMAAAAPLSRKPTFLQPETSLQPGTGQEDTDYFESGAMFPEPGSHTTIVEKCSISDGSDGSRTTSATQQHLASRFSSGSPVQVSGVPVIATDLSPASEFCRSDLIRYTSNCGSGDRRVDYTSDDGREMELRDCVNNGRSEGKEVSERPSLGDDQPEDSGVGAASGATAPASQTASLAAAFGESSSLRFNQMVQSLSTGLRETRRVHRRPLLGSLDGEDELHRGVNDEAATERALPEIEGSCRYTTGPSSREITGGWSAWSRVGGGNDGSLQGPLLLVGEKEQQSRVVATEIVNAGINEDERRAGNGTPELAAASADSASTKAAGNVTDFISAAEWFRTFGRPDGEHAEVLEGEEARLMSEGGGCDPLPLALPQQEEGEDGGGGAGGRDGATPASVASLPLVESGADGGVGGAAVAVALAAAERGGALSAEAAAAARRWEAKLKGSLVSMTGGVRWGLGPQRMKGDTFSKS